MKQISEICPDFLEKYSLYKEYNGKIDPFLALSKQQSKTREQILNEYLTKASVPKLSLPMIPQYRFMCQDEKLPVIYTNMTTGGTITIYTKLPICMTQSECIALAEKMGANRIHWVLLDYLEYENASSQFTTSWDKVEEVVDPEKVWENFVTTSVVTPDILKKNLQERIVQLNMANAAELPSSHPMAFAAKTILSTYPVLSSSVVETNEALFKMFTVQTLVDYNICPLALYGNNIVLGVSARIDTPTKQTIKAQLPDPKIHFQCVLLPEMELKRLITGLNVTLTTRQLNQQGNFGYTEDTDIEYEQYVINPEEVRKEIRKDKVISAQTLLDSLLMQAIQENASDIHLSMRNRGIRIRLRINGILKDVEQGSPIPYDLGKQLLARVQVISRIDTQHKDLPQDGQFKFKLQDLPCEVRVNSSENINGLHIVMRLQVPQANLQDLETLGIDPYELKVLKDAVDADNGMTIICGPTGSGKSTTLYAVLKAIDRIKYNVLTAEQPVERKIPNVEQTNIIKGSPYNFSEFIVAAMRQDPDYLLIGETRDKETATEIIRAAITGHVVFTTLHTNTAALAPARLIDLTHEPYLLADALTALCSQRLLPKLCPYCMEKVEIPSSAKLREFGIKDEWLMGAGNFYHARGCPHCRGTGRITRVCIMEAFLINQHIRELISKEAPVHEIVAAQTAQGSHQLYEKAIRKVARGEVALEDALPLKLTGIY